MAMAIKLSLLLFFFFFFFISSLIPPTFSLYEDQVGFMDWHQRYIGKVKDAVFHTQKAGRKRVVVSTEENVIASLDLRRGEIFWRHVLGANDIIDKIDIALGKYVITLSSQGSILRAWNLPDGQMVWESFLSASNSSKALLTVPANLKVDLDSPIFVYGGGVLHAISSIDGELLWKKDLATEGIDVHLLILPAGSSAVHAVGVTDLSQFDTYEIDVRNGALLKHTSASFPGGIYGEILPISSDRFVALDASRSVLVLITIENGQIHLQQTHVSDLVHGSSGNTVIIASKLSGIFSVSTDTCIAFIRVSDGGKLSVMEKVDKNVVVSDALALSEGEQAFALVQHGDSKIHLSVRLVHDMSSNHLKETVKMDHERGFVHKIFINNYVRTDRSHGFRALIVMEDHSLLLLQQGEIVWSRDDGLASIIDVTTSELPVEKIGVTVTKVEHSLFEWLQGHMLKLKGTLMLATPDEIAALQKMRLQSSEKSKMTRDHNGFRKLLIVLTRAGKLFALHTGDGRVVWSSLLQSLRRSQQCAAPTGLKLHQWQIPHHHALDTNPSVLVVGRCGLSLTSPSSLSIVDTYTGKELQNMGPTHSTVQVISLPFSDSTEQQLHLLIDAEKRAHLYPRTPEAAQIFKRQSEDVYWYSVETEAGILRGYGVKSGCNLDVPNDEYCFETKNLWSVVFPSETEKIIATVTRKENEVVHTQAKVIADEDVMYKYVSKNMLFVATVSPKASGPIGSATPDESVLVVHLVDTVTGRILHRMTHLGSQGPVHAVLSENWVVYHYFNLRAHKYEMSVIEIYDQSRAENKDVLKLIVGKHNLTAPVSSYSRPEITTKSQSYFFTHSVKAISVTSTAKGITSKHLLIGTIGDQVLALDKRFVDPRRSLNPTQAEKEEGLLPLTDTLPIIPQSYATHAFKVEGLRGIETVPAKLESTTLVFAYGVDLFFTRLAPSRTYDSLTEDFNYALLLLTIVALVVAIFVTWVLSERKDLQDKWR